MKKVRLISMMTILSAISILAVAQQGPRNGNGQGRQNQEREGRHSELNLTEDQQTKMEELRLSVQKQMLPLSNELNENKARMRTLTTAENADMKAINKLIDANSEVTTKMQKLRAANHQEVRSMLTEEQRLKFDMGRQSRRDQGRQFQRSEREYKQYGKGPGSGLGPK